MATAILSSENSRFTDLCDEPVDRLLSPIRGYEDKPLVPLTETIKPISGFFNDIEDYVFVALYNCQDSADDLTQQESAAIHLYTMQFYGGPSLYFVFNQSLRAENREELKPWFSFLKLFLTALYKLPSQNGTVWRGVKNIDLSSKYKKGKTFAWWGVSSCTTDIEVLESDQFLGKHGLRTLFSIECINGKSVTNHSYFKKTEKEIILMPGSYFEVIGLLNPAPELHIIQVKEIPPPITFVKSPLNDPANINPSSVVKKLHTVSQSTSNIFPQKIPMKLNNKWKHVGITVAGGNWFGNKLNQLYLPEGIYIDDDQTIYIADFGNHRIVEWKSHAKNGRIVAGGNEKGNQMNQLSCPIGVIIDKENDSLIISDYENRRIMQWSRQNSTKGEILISDIDCYCLTMDKDRSLYISDYKKHEVRRWKRGEKNGTIVAGGNGQGDQLNQFNFPTYIFVDQDYSSYVSDSDNHRVMKWLKDAEEGIVVAGGNGRGNSLTQLSRPQGLIIDQLDQIYVADGGNNRVMRWCEGSRKGTIVVDGKGAEKVFHQLYGPSGLSFDRQGNLYVSDFWNHRIQKFEIDSNEEDLSEYIEL